MNEVFMDAGWLATLAQPLHYSYMRTAMWVCMLVGAVCALLSCFLMLRGWSLVGDALSHAIVPGVAGAAILGLPLAAGAFLSGGMAAAAMLWLGQHGRLKQDAAIGLVFTAFFALGLFLVSLWPRSISVQTIIMGNVLAVSPEDARQLLGVAAITLLALLLKWKDWMLIFFDEIHARSAGLAVASLKLVFFALLAACTVAAMQAVGAFLVVCLIVTPGAAASLLSDRFGRVLLWAAAIGGSCGLLGVYVSYFIDGNTGAVIALLQTLVFALAFLFAPKHGLLRAARARQEAVAAVPDKGGMAECGT
ncbi:MAG: metal ABC transporter permease [Comamonadaceae bacterium]|nr:metal ABC transporter permease [Comamonadaceae bacterium]